MEKLPKDIVEGDKILPETTDSQPIKPVSESEGVSDKELSSKTIAIESMKQSADAALAHAFESADEPLEGQRERRVELKGNLNIPDPAGSSTNQATTNNEPSNDSQSHGAVQKPPSQPPPISYMPQSNQPIQKDEKQKNLPDAYKRSIALGFYGALVILIIWMLLLLIF